MPLKSGRSKAVRDYNIGELIAAGHPPNQSAAIAYSKAGMYHKSKNKVKSKYRKQTWS